MLSDRFRKMLSGQSTILLKVLMAISGLIMAAFVIFHLYNNAHFFLGQEVYNTKGFSWKKPGVIETARVVLLSSIVLHIATGILLTWHNRKARPERYIQQRYQRAGMISRTLIYTGLVIASFVAFHVLHAKAGMVFSELHELVDIRGKKDVYNMIIFSFRRPSVAIAYLVSLACIGLHLSHGIKSTCMTLGLSNDQNENLIHRISVGISLFLFVGYSLIPLSVILRIVNPVE